MNKKFVFYALIMSVFVLGIGSLVPSVIADPDKDRQNPRDNNNIQDFGNGVVVQSSSTTLICHVPPGNPDAAHDLVVGTPAAEHHLDRHDGDHMGTCVT